MRTSFTISLKRSTLILQLSTSWQADYPIFESRAIKRGNSVTFTNRDGSRFTVRAVWHGNTQLIYNSNGQLIRKTIRHSDGTATFYDANGNIVGSSRK
jgi:hypothetical protein